MKVKAYITKYALTKGIEVVDGITAKECPEMLTVTAGAYRSHYHGDDWHTTPEAAIKRAELMRKNKVNSLKKSLAAVRDVKFVVPDEVLEPVYPGPDLREDDFVFTPEGEMAQVYCVTEDNGVMTTKGTFCASVLRRAKKGGSDAT